LSGENEKSSGSATLRNGKDNDAILAAPAPMANLPKKFRRFVVGLESDNCIKINFGVKNEFMKSIQILSQSLSK
jgi:hypothetical protein